MAALTFFYHALYYQLRLNMVIKKDPPIDWVRIQNSREPRARPIEELINENPPTTIIPFTNGQRESDSGTDVHKSHSNYSQESSGPSTCDESSVTTLDESLGGVIYKDSIIIDDDDEVKAKTKDKQKIPSLTASQLKLLELESKNQRIIISNIRHHYVLFWIIVFANAITLLALGSLIHHLISHDQRLYSVDLVYRYLLPCIIITICGSTFYLLLSVLRVHKISSTPVKGAYYMICAVHLLYFITALTIASLDMTDNLAKLKGIITADLNNSKIHKIAENLEFTQLQRQCCGVHGAKDWMGHSLPLTCCDHTQGDEHSTKCIPWKGGCYKKEYFWISWYNGWYLSITALEFLFATFLTVQVQRLLHFVKKYRPRPHPKRRQKNFDKSSSKSTVAVKMSTVYEKINDDSIYTADSKSTIAKPNVHCNIQEDPNSNNSKYLYK